MSNLEPNVVLGGRYLIQEEIGKGGMGIVYSARDQDAGGRLCAIKVLKEQHSTEKSKRRFEEEIRCVLKLNSPHIVKVFATGTTSVHYGARQYVVMEHIEGVPLSDLLKGELLGPERAVHVALGVTSALQVAHREGVVHRDLKPANIIVGDIELGGVVKILDFGIAKDLSRDETLNLTRTGMLVGTPTYMSPERFQIDEPLTPAADLYSVGLLLYHMIDGRSPIYLKHPSLPPEIRRLPAPLQVCWLHVNYTPPILTSCPPALAKLTQALLAKEPGDRPTAQETYTQLTQILSDAYNPEQEAITESLPQDLFDSVLSQYTPPPIERDPSAHSPELLQGQLTQPSHQAPHQAIPATPQLGLLESNQPTVISERPAPVKTLLLKADDMAALNEELDQMVAQLSPQGQGGPARAPLVTFPMLPLDQPSTQEPLPNPKGPEEQRDRHMLSTLRLDSGAQRSAELQALNMQLQSYASPAAPASHRHEASISAPAVSSAPPPASAHLETYSDLDLTEHQSVARWLLPIISLCVGAAVSYWIMSQG